MGTPSKRQCNVRGEALILKTLAEPAVTSQTSIFRRFISEDCVVVTLSAPLKNEKLTTKMRSVGENDIVTAINFTKGKKKLNFYNGYEESSTVIVSGKEFELSQEDLEKALRPPVKELENVMEEEDGKIVSVKVQFMSKYAKNRSIDFAIRNPERRQVSLRVPLDLIENLPKWMESSNFEKCDVIIKGVMKSSYLGTHYQIPMIYLEYVHTSTIQLQSEALLRQTGVITAIDEDTVVIQDEESSEIFYFVTTDTSNTIDYNIDTESRVEFTAQYGELKSIKLLVE